jgi:hypothetical protein
MLDPTDQKYLAHDWWAFEGVIAPIARRILEQTMSSSSCKRNWSSYSFMHNKSRNRLQLKRIEDLVYVYTNSRLMAEGKEKDEKKWYVDNANNGDFEDSDSAPKEDVEVHGDPNLDGGDVGVQNLDGEMHCSPLLSNLSGIRDWEDEYNFHDDGDDHLDNLPSIATYVHGDGLLNSDSILQKCSTVEDVEDVVTTKANSVREICTEEENSVVGILPEKGHATAGGEKGNSEEEEWNGKVVGNKIADPVLKVDNASAKKISRRRIWSTQ